MRKVILPVITTALLMASVPADAQMMRHDPFNNFFDTMFFNPQNMAPAHFVQPRMDMADLPDKIEIKAELPGMDENNVTLTCEDGILTLSGENQQSTEEQSKDYYMKEMSSGSFSRSVRLPKNVDESKIDAVFKNGILTITIPKIEPKNDTVKKIPIKKGE